MKYHWLAIFPGLKDPWLAIVPGIKYPWLATFPKTVKIVLQVPDFVAGKCVHGARQHTAALALTFTQARKVCAPRFHHFFVLVMTSEFLLRNNKHYTKESVERIETPDDYYYPMLNNPHSNPKCLNASSNLITNSCRTISARVGSCVKYETIIAALKSKHSKLTFICLQSWSLNVWDVSSTYVQLQKSQQPSEENTYFQPSIGKSEWLLSASVTEIR